MLGPFGLLDNLLLSARTNEESRKSHADLLKCHIFAHLLSFFLILTTTGKLSNQTRKNNWKVFVTWLHGNVEYEVCFWEKGS
jgi:hypothetical protein